MNFAHRVKARNNKRAKSFTRWTVIKLLYQHDCTIWREKQTITSYLVLIIISSVFPGALGFINGEILTLALRSKVATHSQDFQSLTILKWVPWVYVFRLYTHKHIQVSLVPLWIKGLQKYTINNSKANTFAYKERSLWNSNISSSRSQF